MSSRASIRALAASTVSALALVTIQAVAQPTQPPATPAVFTRASVASFHQDEHHRFYVRLKLMPRSKLPFTTQTFRVTDRSLVADIPEGSSVEFTARHVDGENVVTAIQMVAECQRFQRCD